MELDTLMENVPQPTRMVEWSDFTTHEAIAYSRELLAGR